MSLWLRRWRRRDLRTHLYIATVIKFLATYVYIFLIFFLIFLLDFIIVTINLIQLLAAILIRINYLSLFLSRLWIENFHLTPPHAYGSFPHDQQKPLSCYRFNWFIFRQKRFRVKKKLEPIIPQNLVYFRPAWVILKSFCWELRKSA